MFLDVLSLGFFIFWLGLWVMIVFINDFRMS